MVMGRHEEGCDRGGKHVLDDTTGAAEGKVMDFY